MFRMGLISILTKCKYNTEQSYIISSFLFCCYHISPVYRLPVMYIEDNNFHLLYKSLLL